MECSENFISREIIYVLMILFWKANFEIYFVCFKNCILEILSEYLVLKILENLF